MWSLHLMMKNFLCVTSIYKVCCLLAYAAHRRVGDLDHGDIKRGIIFYIPIYSSVSTSNSSLGTTIKSAVY